MMFSILAPQHYILAFSNPTYTFFLVSFTGSAQLQINDDMEVNEDRELLLNLVAGPSSVDFDLSVPQARVIIEDNDALGW